jgi:hypothetical protein
MPDDDTRGIQNRGTGERVIQDRGLLLNNEPIYDVSKPSPPPIPGAITIPCSNEWSDLGPLIENLLNAKAANLVLYRETYLGYRISTLTVTFLGKGEKEEIVRSWSYYENLRPSRRERATTIPSIIFQESPDFRAKPMNETSKSNYDLELFRKNAMDHIRLFREVVGTVQPEWLQRFRNDLQTMARWIASWNNYETERWVVSPDDPIQKRETKTIDLTLDEPSVRIIKKRIGRPGNCEVRPITIHFNLDRPKMLSEEEGVLLNPEEFENSRCVDKPIVLEANCTIRRCR